MSNNPLGGLGNILGRLFGQQAPHRQEDYQDLSQRLDRYNDPNDPTDHTQFDPNQVQQHYGHMLRNAPPDVMDDAQEQAFQRLTPQQREELARQLFRYQQQNGMGSQQIDPRQLAQDPRALGQALRQTEQQQPGMLDQLFGGASGALSNPLVKMALAAAAAAAARRFLSGGQGGLGQQQGGGLGDALGGLLGGALGGGALGGLGQQQQPQQGGGLGDMLGGLLGGQQQPQYPQQQQPQQGGGLGDMLGGLLGGQRGNDISDTNERNDRNQGGGTDNGFSGSDV